MRKLFLNIEEPCHQNWNEMTPAANGRFCGHCSKEVIDFSIMSDHAIITYIEKNKGKILCGNFEPGQLNRWLEGSEIRDTNPMLYKFLVGVLLLAASQTGIAQQTKPELTYTVMQHPKTGNSNTDIDTVKQPLSNVFENCDIHIRGMVGYRRNTDSMLVVDGAPTPFIWLQRIPADKIRSKTVLKGATAAAIFGPEGANGVTIITTGFTKRERKRFFKQKISAEIK